MKMKKPLISAVISLVMLINISVPAIAFNYSFSSGADYGGLFAKSTSTDALVQTDPMSENVRRNKDTAYNPPPYGMFSGDIPTDPSSPYHSNPPPSSGISSGSSGSVSHSSMPASGGNISMSVNGTTEAASSDLGGMLPSTSVSAYSPDIVQTLPLYYDDGSIGILHIPKLNLSVKLFEGESLDNMLFGVGRFEFTSAWDGNVGIAGHNRGVPHAIGDVKELADGDEIIYTTKYGTRTYAVFEKKQISDTDYSVLGWSEFNILTIITCVNGIPDRRWAVTAREVI